jgi:hypothetical protein
MKNEEVAALISEFREELAKVRTQCLAVMRYSIDNFMAADKLASLHSMLRDDRYPDDRTEVLARRLVCERREAMANAAKAGATLAENEQLRAQLARKRKNARRG